MRQSWAVIAVMAAIVGSVMLASVNRVSAEIIIKDRAAIEEDAYQQRQYIIARENEKLAEEQRMEEESRILLGQLERQKNVPASAAVPKSASARANTAACVVLVVCCVLYAISRRKHSDRGS
ncbi:MAG: hypothetical protein WCG78_04120 [Candidatus Omnitrophota bacterium]